MQKNLYRSLVLFALFNSCKAVDYPDVEGHCPMQYGQLLSNVKDTLNPHRLTGHWMNVFDRGVLNNNHKCYGVKLVHSQGFDEFQKKVENEEHMKDIPKIFEYMKMTNVGESKDELDPENNTEDFDFVQNTTQPEDIDLLAFGYHAYHGFQLQFVDESDKSLARVLHQDMNLSEHEDENVKEHGHDDDKEGYFNNYVFDSQFKRYAQVLDTDYDNFMVLYECFETASYYDKNTGKQMPDYEAWEHSKSSSIDFKKWPQTSFTFEDTIKVEPRHFENVKILWRPQKKLWRPDDPEMSEEQKDEEMKQTPVHQHIYLKKEDDAKMKEKVEDLKKMIKDKHPKLDLSTYKLLDHQNGKCDYDPYDTNMEIEFHDEGEFFGHMKADGILPSDAMENNEEYESYMGNYKDEQDENEDWPADQEGEEQEQGPEESYEQYAQGDEFTEQENVDLGEEGEYLKDWEYDTTGQQEEEIHYFDGEKEEQSQDFETEE